MKLHVGLAALPVVVAPMIVQAAVPTAGAKAEDSNKITCRVTRPIGSRLGGVRTCRTAAEWVAYQAEMRDVVHRIQGEGATFCVPNPTNPVSTC
jgi:hypothetical protein